MQTIAIQALAVSAPPPNLPDRGSLSPAGMARHLRRASGDAALCFAQAMYDDSAWASDRWATYWADVIRLV